MQLEPSCYLTIQFIKDVIILCSAKSSAGQACASLACVGTVLHIGREGRDCGEYIVVGLGLFFQKY